MPASISGIETRLWNVDDDLRPSFMLLKPLEYLIPMLGLIFLRSADCKFEWEVQDQPCFSFHRTATS